jgi:hypothetical protein
MKYCENGCLLDGDGHIPKNNAHDPPLLFGCRVVIDTLENVGLDVSACSLAHYNDVPSDILTVSCRSSKVHRGGHSALESSMFPP